jgi:hypothetical protein
LLAQAVKAATGRYQVVAFASRVEAEWHFNLDADSVNWGDWVYLYPAQEC